MGKKGSWLSTFIRIFKLSSKEKLTNGPEKKCMKFKKKWGFGKLKHGEAHSFIPLYRKPSSIEKILEDADRENQMAHAIHAKEDQKTHFLPPKDHQETSPLSPSSASHCRKDINHLATTPDCHHIAAIKIQTAYRGYMARKNFRTLKSLVRLQGVVQGQFVKRQVSNSLKCMQLHVKMQHQIHSRRIQMMKNQALKCQNLQKVFNDLENNSSQRATTQFSEAESQDWDDSILTKEDIESRLQKKMEALVKRERAIAYAYPHQLWKGTPKSTANALMEIKSGRFPWWWNRLQYQLPTCVLRSYTKPKLKNNLIQTHAETAPVTPQNNSYKLINAFEDVDIATPTSMKSLTVKAMFLDTPSSLRRLNAKHTGDDISMSMTPRDNKSLSSCPPFSVPNYMSPTISTKAKERGRSTPKVRSMGGTRMGDSDKRLSFPLTQGTGRWRKGSPFTEDSISPRIPSDSFGNMSMDSTFSLPAGAGRRYSK